LNLPSSLLKGRLIRRYKRFLADIELEDGTIVTAHTPNSGSMKGCNTPGSLVLLSLSDNPARKLKYTWELIRVGEHWVGINTGYPNKLVREGIENGTVSELQGYTTVRPEVKYGMNSRIDLLLEGTTGKCYVEVKNVTLAENEYALFPDAVTERGQKHLRELKRMVAVGNRAVIFFVVQRQDARFFSPADSIDPVYGELLREVMKYGVEGLVYQAVVSPEQIFLNNKLPLVLH
jgi:sugar fermentation stimulation protein A